MIVVSSFVLYAGGRTEVTESAEVGPSILRYGEDMTEITTVDVYKSTYNEAYEIGSTMAETLIGKNPKTLDLEPLLLEKMPEISADGLLYTFKLKEGVLFHDGTELTTSDVIFSLNRFYHPDTASLVSDWFDTYIVGVKDVQGGKAETISGIEIVDDYTFTIKLERKYPALLSILASAFYLIYPEEACTAAGDEWGKSVFIGTGPYSLETFEPSEHLVMAKFNDYHGTSDGADKIEILNMSSTTQLLEFKAGNIDIALIPASVLVTYTSDPEISGLIHDQSLMGTYTLFLNMDIAPLDNPKVRRAVAMATDKDSLSEGLLEGNFASAYSFLPPGMPGNRPESGAIEYNPQKAKALLAEAGYPNGITIEVTATEGSSFVDYYTVLQQSYAKAGIDLKINMIDRGSWFDTRSTGSIQAYIFNWYADFTHPDNFLGAITVGNRKFFSTGMSDQSFQKMIDDGKTIADAAEIDEFYFNLERKLTQEMVQQVPLLYPKSYFLVSDKVDNVWVKEDFLWYWSNAQIVK
jgi:ABC-type transport system substrate-binding protein